MNTAARHAYAPSCASCVRLGVELAATEIDGRSYLLCQSCRCEDLDLDALDSVDVLSESTYSERVMSALRGGDGFAIAEIIALLGHEGQKLQSDGVRKAVSRLVRRGAVRAEGEIGHSGGATYRLVRR